MASGAYCRKCGRVIFSARDKIGQAVSCPGCGETLEIVAAVSRDSPVNLACPRCQSMLRIVRELHGRRVRCTTCQAVYEVSASPWKLLPIVDPARP